MQRTFCIELNKEDELERMYDTLQDWRTIYVPRGLNQMSPIYFSFTIPNSKAMHTY